MGSPVCQPPAPPLPRTRRRRAPGPIPRDGYAGSQPKHSPAQAVRAPPREGGRVPTGARAKARSCPAVPPTRGGTPATAPRSPAAPRGRSVPQRSEPFRSAPSRAGRRRCRRAPAPGAPAPLWRAARSTVRAGSGAARPPPSPAPQRAFPTRSRRGKEGKKAAPRALPPQVPPRAAPRLHDAKRLRDGYEAGEGWTPGKGCCWVCHRDLREGLSGLQ